MLQPPEKRKLRRRDLGEAKQASRLSRARWVAAGVAYGARVARFLLVWSKGKTKGGSMRFGAALNLGQPENRGSKQFLTAIRKVREGQQSTNCARVPRRGRVVVAANSCRGVAAGPLLWACFAWTDELKFVG